MCLLSSSCLSSSPSSSSTFLLWNTCSLNIEKKGIYFAHSLKCFPGYKLLAAKKVLCVLFSTQSKNVGSDVLRLFWKTVPYHSFICSFIQQVHGAGCMSAGPCVCPLGTEECRSAWRPGLKGFPLSVGSRGGCGARLAVRLAADVCAELAPFVDLYCPGYFVAVIGGL